MGIIPKVNVIVRPEFDHAYSPVRHSLDYRESSSFLAEYECPFNINYIVFINKCGKKEIQDHSLMEQSQSKLY